MRISNHEEVDFVQFLFSYFTLNSQSGYILDELEPLINFLLVTELLVDEIELLSGLHLGLLLKLC